MTDLIHSLSDTLADSPSAVSTLLTSTVIVAVAEIGDKTQLLSLLLTLRFRNKPAIVMGILLATLLNHALSAWLGVWLEQSLQQWADDHHIEWILAAGFTLMALWVLIPDKEDDETNTHEAWGAFLATCALFFVAEIGDKTQVATVLLGAEYSSVFWVTAGTTLGMLAANIPVIYFGERLMRRMPLHLARYLTSALFLILAVSVIWAG